ncbi:hypothetical protein Pyrde_0485 [Pyrodictium delaneyi]|nr:hypothetical protein [Pyrodictium delaneyi]ALL00535.1 hypothetical protein Pyrde_0485 [Pyrodictium delaneyi]
MKMRVSLAIVMFAILATVGLVSVAAALTTDEAKQLFQSKGCTGCHNGAMAPDFEGTVAVIKEWASKYASLDEAVAAEAPNFKMFNNAKTWDELMNAMPGITPELKDYFAKVFEEAKSGGAAPAQEEKPTEASTTEAETPTTTTTKPVPVQTQQPVKPKPTVTYQKLPQVPVPNPSEEAEPLVQTGLPVGLALYLAAVGVLVIAMAVASRR